MSSNSITVEISSNNIIAEVAPQAVNVDFRTVKTRDINFGYDVFTGDGTTTKFTLSAQAKTNGLVLFVNGILAKQGASATYTLNSTLDEITFNTAPEGGSDPDEIVAFYAKA